MNHTPGPWNVHPSYQIQDDWTPIECSEIPNFFNWDAYVASDKKIIAEVKARRFEGGEVIGWPNVEDIDEAKANLALIVAAPTMLHVLRVAQNLLMHPGGASDPEGVLALISATIDEAKGRDPNAELKTAPVKSVDCSMGDHAGCSGEEPAIWPDGTQTVRKCNCDCHAEGGAL